MLVAHLSTFPPTRCGIAWFTDALIRSIGGCAHLRLRSSSLGTDFAFGLSSRNTYSAMAKALETLGVDVVSVQHEFGLYSGPDGADVIGFFDSLSLPVVTTFHTISSDLTTSRKRLISKLVQRSARVVAMTERAANVLINEHRALPERLSVIHHGTPESTKRIPKASLIRRGQQSTISFVSTGLLRPNKGYETAIRALGMFSKLHPEQPFVYLILGSDHPVKAGGGNYRRQVFALASEVGIANQIVFLDEVFAELELCSRLAACDVGLAPYACSAHSSSGTIPLMLACGLPVVTTRNEYAEAIHERCNEALAITDLTPSAFLAQICRLVELTEAERKRIAFQARTAVAGSGWIEVGAKYRTIFAHLATERQGVFEPIASAA